MANETKLAVILHADVVGSTELVQRDERLAHERIQDAFRRFSTLISDNGGTTREIRGDALVVEFARASDAANAALAFQVKNQAHNEALTDDVRPELRIGIALGEVVIADGTVTGSGVVLAQRLEQLAPPGSVCISAAIREALPGRIRLAYEDLGDLRLKGFERPQRAYLVAREVDEGQGEKFVTEKNIPSQRAQRASVAVLPFNNMSSDPEQEFFADGMAEDIITALSKFKDLLVIARNTTFTFKGQSVDVKDVASRMGVQYVVEGSVRKAGNRIRVTSQLIDGDTGTHIWANRYDRVLEDIFEVQDEVVRAIVGAIAPQVELAERSRARRAPLSLDAWSKYQLGLSSYESLDRSELGEAARYFLESSDLDSEFSPTLVGLGLTRIRQAILGYATSTAEALSEAHQYFTKALTLDGDDAAGRAGFAAYHQLSGNHEAAEQEARRAIELNPNLVIAHFILGWLHSRLGRPEEAIEAFKTIERLNPMDPRIWRTEMLRGSAHRALGQFDEAIRYGRKACEAEGNSAYMAHVNLATSLAMAGYLDEAKACVVHAVEKEPALSISWLRDSSAARDERSLDQMVEGLRLAGLRENS